MYNVLVVGATGRVGSELISLLQEREFPIDQLFCVASDESLGKRIYLEDDTVVKVSSLDLIDFSSLGFVFVATSDYETVVRVVAEAVKHHVFVINCNNKYSLLSGIPLIIPEINAADIRLNIKNCIFSSPSAIATFLALCLYNLHKDYDIKRLVVATYQSVSGAGNQGLAELFEQTKDIYLSQPVQKTKQVFTKQIAFNAIPHIGAFNEFGSSFEEEMIIKQVNTIFTHRVPLSVHCVRIPTLMSEGAAVNVEFNDHLTEESLVRILADLPSVGLVNHQADEGYVSHVEAAGEDKVYVSRVRQDTIGDNIFNMWIVGDNLRKGSALNMIQIAEEILAII